MKWVTNTGNGFRRRDNFRYRILEETKTHVECRFLGSKCGNVGLRFWKGLEK
jgi:hypothetical protein